MKVQIREGDGSKSTPGFLTVDIDGKPVLSVYFGKNKGFPPREQAMKVAFYAASVFNPQSVNVTLPQNETPTRGN